jgi:hypothetical protein
VPELEYKSAPAAMAVRPLGSADAALGSGVVSAMVAVTGVRDHLGDKIIPGTFARTLREIKTRPCADHKWDPPVGWTLGIYELPPGHPDLPKKTAYGTPWPAQAGAVVANYQCDLARPEGRSAYRRARRLDRKCLYSIGYITRRATVVPEGRDLYDLDLYEYSQVWNPAHPLASQLSVKSGDDLTSRVFSASNDIDDDIDDDELEVKMRKYVHDSSYWGLPVGTPIKPGMKPRGNAARKLRHAGIVPSRDQGVTDKPPAKGQGQRVNAADRMLAVHEEGLTGLDIGSNTGDPYAHRVRAHPTKAKGRDAEHVAMLANAERDLIDKPNQANTSQPNAESARAMSGLLDEGITPDELREDLADIADNPHNYDSVELSPDEIDDVVHDYAQRYTALATQQRDRREAGQPEHAEPVKGDSTGGGERSQNGNAGAPDGPVAGKPIADPYGREAMAAKRQATWKTKPAAAVGALPDDKKADYDALSPEQQKVYVDQRAGGTEHPAAIAAAKGQADAPDAGDANGYELTDGRALAPVEPRTEGVLPRDAEAQAYELAGNDGQTLRVYREAAPLDPRRPWAFVVADEHGTEEGAFRHYSTAADSLDDAETALVDAEQGAAERVTEDRVAETARQAAEKTKRDAATTAQKAEADKLARQSAHVVPDAAPMSMTPEQFDAALARTDARRRRAENVAGEQKAADTQVRQRQAAREAAAAAPDQLDLESFQSAYASRRGYNLTNVVAIGDGKLAWSGGTTQKWGIYSGDGTQLANAGDFHPDGKAAGSAKFTKTKLVDLGARLAAITDDQGKPVPWARQGDRTGDAAPDWMTGWRDSQGRSLASVVADTANQWALDNGYGYKRAGHNYSRPDVVPGGAPDADGFRLRPIDEVGPGDQVKLNDGTVITVASTSSIHFNEVTSEDGTVVDLRAKARSGGSLGVSAVPVKFTGDPDSPQALREPGMGPLAATLPQAPGQPFGQGDALRRPPEGAVPEGTRVLTVPNPAYEYAVPGEIVRPKIGVFLDRSALYRGDDFQTVRFDDGTYTQVRPEAVARAGIEAHKQRGTRETYVLNPTPAQINAAREAYDLPPEGNGRAAAALEDARSESGGVPVPESVRAVPAASALETVTPQQSTPTIPSTEVFPDSLPPESTVDSGATATTSNKVEITPDLLDEAASVQDDALGITEQPDGSIIVTPEVAARQQRVEELLAADEVGTLDLHAKSTGELTTVKTDLSEELRLQAVLATRAGTPKPAAARGDAPQEKPAGRPGLAGAAQDYAEALRGTDTAHIERTRARLHSSVRRSRANSASARALAEHVTADGGHDATKITALATGLKEEARQRRNEAARNRRLARRIERARIQSLLDRVDTELSGRQAMSPDDRIRAAWQQLAVKQQDWIRLARIRPLLGDMSREEQDATLLRMYRAGDLHLAPDSNRKVQTADDHAAAIRLGGEDLNLIAFEDLAPASPVRTRSGQPQTHTSFGPDTADNAFVDALQPDDKVDTEYGSATVITRTGRSITVQLADGQILNLVIGSPGYYRLRRPAG